MMVGTRKGTTGTGNAEDPAHESATRARFTAALRRQARGRHDPLARGAVWAAAVSLG
jgi:hypothetical protein